MCENIDRLLSIWQGLREKPDDKNAWVTSEKSGWENWLTSGGGTEDNETPLLPFYRSDDQEGKEKFWKSSQVRDTAEFGYAYPETQSWKFDTTEKYRDSIKDKLRTLYPASSIANMAIARRAGIDKPDNTLRERAKRLTQIQKAEAPATTETALALAPNLPDELRSILPDVKAPPIEEIEIPRELSVLDLIKDDTYLEWLVNIKAEKHAFGGQYAVHIFVGPIPEHETTALYGSSPYHVGTFFPFGQSEQTSCGKCQEDQAAGLEITGQIPLTIALAERYFAGQLPGLDETAVKEYLVEHLHWEVVDQHGQRLKPEGKRNLLPGLLLGVVSNEVTPPNTAEGFPSYSENVTVHPEITTRRDGSGRGDGTGATRDEKRDCC
ncbi:hypothetical protein ACHAPJ_011550 [Fusarium lateritium]